MAYIIKKLRAPIRATGFAGLTATALAALSIHERLAPPSESDALTDAYIRRWARSMLTIFGIKLNLHSPLPPPPRSARLIVSNHRSPVDILVLVSLFGGSFLSRGDLAKWPLIGKAATKVKTIFVDRTNSASGVQAIRAMRQRLKEKGTVIVFPEGTTFEGDEVRPFKPGAFLASHRMPCDLVPVGLAYEPGAEFKNESFMQYMARMSSAKSLRVDVCVGTPSLADDHAQDSALRFHDEVAELVKKARSFAPPQPSR